MIFFIEFNLRFKYMIGYCFLGISFHINKLIEHNDIKNMSSISI